MKHKLQILNNISKIGLDRLPDEVYALSEDEANPDAILLRSQNLHDMNIQDSLLAVGRAGAGVNNIPVQWFGEARIFDDFTDDISHHNILRLGLRYMY